MTKSIYEVIESRAGKENLQNTLNEIADKGGDIVSVVPGYREGLFGLTPEDVEGYLVVVRRTA